MEQCTGIILPHLEEFRQQQHQPQQPEADWVNPEIPGPSVKMCSHTNVQSHQPQQPEADWVNPGDTGTVCGME
ncbi:hypothetical protein ACTBMB_002855 [Escherichia coli]